MLREDPHQALFLFSYSPMHPIIEIGFVQLSTYKIIGILAVIVMGMVAFERLQRLEQPSGVIGRGLLLTVVGGYASGYLMQYIINLQRGSGEPEGLSIIWAIVGGIIIAAIYCWKYRISVGQALDLAGPPVALGLAIGRLGCFAAGCCHGLPTTSWLGMHLPDEHGVWMMRYPTQLMSAGTNLLIFFVLLAVERYGIRRSQQEDLDSRIWPFDGFMALLGLLLFSLKRYGIGFLRESTGPAFGPFDWMHWQALVGIAITAGLILWNVLRIARRRQHFDNV